jgi:hypothetical protein
MTLKMDEATHGYTVDGRVIPSVTKIIYAVLAIDEKYERLREEGFLVDPEPYAKFGTAVHRACELHVKGTLNREEMDPLLEPALTAFIQFIKDTGFDILESETMTYSKKFWYAGTYDLYGSFGGKFAIVDIKTGTIQKWHNLQTAGYAMLKQGTLEPAANFPLIDRYCLYLDRDKPKYKLKKHKDDRDMKFWEQMVSVFHGKERYQ